MAAGPLALATGLAGAPWVGGSARPNQLLAHGGEGLFLGQRSRQAHLSMRHRHRADLHLRRGGPQGEPLEDGEPRGSGLGPRSR